MPVTDWTFSIPGVFGDIPPNCGAGCIGNTWNLPSYNPDDNIPSLQAQIDNPELPSPPLELQGFPYIASNSSVIDDRPEGLLYGEGTGSAWEDPVDEIGYFVISEVDGEGMVHDFSGTLPGDLLYLDVTGDGSFAVYEIDTFRTFVGSYDMNVSYIGEVSPLPVIELGSPVGFRIEPIGRSATLFYTAQESAVNPGDVSVDAPGIPDDWSQPASTYTTFRFHRLDRDGTDRALLILALVIGRRLRLSHPNGITVFTVTGVTEFDPLYDIHVEYESGFSDPVGLFLEMAIDFLD